MRSLVLSSDPSTPLRILCLGAHSDDIEIGCGGTLLRLTDQYRNCVLHWVVFSAVGVRGDEARRGAELFGSKAVVQGPTLKTFQDGHMPFAGAEIKSVFEEIKGSFSPDIIFTHNRKDAHQDHRVLAELTWNTFRNHLILEYEIPKYDGDLGQPSVFVPLSEEVSGNKVKYIMESFQSQHGKHWFQPNTFLALMRLRGMECAAPSGHAEAFYSRKLVL
jgi:LmbE family N-acetylglucosaminyl deacetylase